MRIHVILSAVAVLAASGCDGVGGYIQARQAKSDVADALPDPSSAEFRRVEHARYGGAGFIVCGEVNSINAFGAKGGFQPFIYASPLLRIADSSESEATIRLCCKTLLESGKVSGVTNTSDVPECAGIEPAMPLI